MKLIIAIIQPDKLDEAEFAIMRQHPVNGAEILRRTPEMPVLAPVMNRVAAKVPVVQETALVSYFVARAEPVTPIASTTAS